MAANASFSGMAIALGDRSIWTSRTFVRQGFSPITTFSSGGSDRVVALLFSRILPGFHPILSSAYDYCAL